MNYIFIRIHIWCEFSPEKFCLTKKDDSNFHKNYLNKEVTLVRKDMDVTDHKRLSNITFSISQSQYLHLYIYIFTEETIQSVSDFNHRK
jgi:hypothetical protein